MRETELARHPDPQIPILVRRQRLIEQARLLQTTPAVHHTKHGYEVANQKPIVVEVARERKISMSHHELSVLLKLMRAMGVRIPHGAVVLLQAMHERLKMIRIVEVVIVQVSDVFASRQL